MRKNASCGVGNALKIAASRMPSMHGWPSRPPRQAPAQDATSPLSVLAGLARFVIADITDATEVRVELHRDFRLPVQPIILQGQSEFVSMSGLRKFPWLLPSFEYANTEHLMDDLEKCVVAPAEAKVLELQGPKPR
jgi:hypothetical protein